MKKTAVVILNWNTKSFLSDFLPTLISSVSGLDAQIVVVDNGSSDGSAELIRHKFAQVKLIAFEHNYGFTGGYNRAIAQLLKEEYAPEYLLLLNSDVLVPKHWLAVLTDYLDLHPNCAVCGPKMLALDRIAQGEDSGVCTELSHKYVCTNRFEYAGAAGGYIDAYGFPFCRGRVLKRTELDNGQYEQSQKVFWISGACMLTRSSVWKKLDGLDERFFAHMEEIDYCWRAQLAGYDIVVLPDSRVYHLGGGTLSASSPFKLKLNFRNSLLMLDNNLADTIGKQRSEFRIFLRMCMDGAVACLYLISGQVACFKAVISAHREFRSLRRASPQKAAYRKLSGIWNFSIIVQSALRGNGIFEYIRRHETEDE